MLHSKRNKAKRERVWLLASGFYSGSAGKAGMAAAYLTDREILGQAGRPFDIDKCPSMETCVKMENDPGEERATSAAYKAGAEYAAMFGFRRVAVWDGADAYAQRIKTPVHAKVRIVHEAAPGPKLERAIQEIMDALDQLAADKAMDPAPPDGSVEIKTLEGEERDADP